MNAKIKIGLIIAMMGITGAIWAQNLQTEIKPGQVWLDATGKVINAHGGCVLFHDGVYYWYGEHKIEGLSERKHADGGVHCYASTDLINWHDHGMMIRLDRPETEDLTHECNSDRPKVIYNEKTGQFVMFFKLYLRGLGIKNAFVGVAVSQSPSGPFTYRHKFVGGNSPNGTGDFAMFKDDDGSLYHLSVRKPDRAFVIGKMRDDYLLPEGEYKVAEGITRSTEAPALIKKDGKYLMLASGSTGWAPCAARSFSATSIYGPWIDHGNPVSGTNPQNGLGPEKTFGGQSNYILKVEGKKDAYIAMFDINKPEHPFESGYIWLPSTFNGNKMSIPWKDQWSPIVKDSTQLITNPDFETGDLKGWRNSKKRSAITTEAFSGKYAVQIGPEREIFTQKIKVSPNSLYQISAYVKTESGAEEVQLMIEGYGGAKKSVSSALTEYTKVSIDFQTVRNIDDLTVKLIHPTGNGSGYVDQVELAYLGEAPEPALQEFIAIPERVLKEQDGVAQLPDDKMDSFLDAKFGMFIHWGVYAAFDEGPEWVRHSKIYGQEYYQQRARDPETGFTASKFDATKWANLAKKAGMKYVVLTSRHHDGYALFDSKHPSSWTSKKDLGRDLIKEYTDAVRASGLHVGLYYSPMSWRYPGYYDITGEDCKPNVWGYTTAAWHKENAREMKEEVYEQVTTLLKDYGDIDYMFWDGGWLSQTVDRIMERNFWDSGLYQNPDNEWPVNIKYITKEEDTGRPLGVMGLVRKYQPDMIVNNRFAWIGDVDIEEGGSTIGGNIRLEHNSEKCVSLQRGGWGHRPNRDVYSFEQVVVYLSNCAVRNINLLLNVAPDREGVIPQNQQDVLVETGGWLDKVGNSIYGTRGGPWQPLFGEYGFTLNDNKIYCHIYEGYRKLDTGRFITQSIGNKKVVKIVNLYDEQELAWFRNNDNTITISGVDYALNPSVTILEITLNESVY